MSTFDTTAWADPAYAQEYLENADHYIPHRPELFAFLRSFCQHLLAPQGQGRICDLGCGDGTLTAHLLSNPWAAEMEFILVDGSAEMLGQAATRLGGETRVSFQQSSFQQLLDGSQTLPPCRLVASAFAIHHLTPAERHQLFCVLRRVIEPGGFFVNIDIVLPEDRATEELYYAWWQEWIDAHIARVGGDASWRAIPQQARANPDNLYGPLTEQLAALRAAGFGAVECHYRNGLFGIYSGSA